MKREEFERLVTKGFETIPEKFRSKVANVTFLVEDEPSEKIRREQGLAADETLFGFYTGLPLSERGDLYGVGMTLPDTILIYQKPIEEEAGGDSKRIAEIVAETVWHEVAHYFGFNETEVRMRERLRKQKR